MSLVGPRPHSLSELGSDPTENVAMKPGLTGLWQISGHSSEDAIQLDREYAKRWSLWLDIKIMFMTMIAAFRKSV
jgi:exopolysaccharide production protein ExoY